MAKPSKKHIIIWDEDELLNFQSFVFKAKEHSEPFAKKIKNRVIANLKLIEQNPYVFQIDRLKSSNDGSYRAFIASPLRFVYKIENNTIYIIRIHHMAYDPSEY